MFLPPHSSLQLCASQTLPSFYETASQTFCSFPPSCQLLSPRRGSQELMTGYWGGLGGGRQGGEKRRGSKKRTLKRLRGKWKKGRGEGRRVEEGGGRERRGTKKVTRRQTGKRRNGIAKALRSVTLPHNLPHTCTSVQPTPHMHECATYPTRA